MFSISLSQEPINISLVDDVYCFNFSDETITTIPYFESLPIFASNQAAIANGYLGKVYRTTDNKVLVGVGNPTPFILNLSKAISCFRRFF